MKRLLLSFITITCAIVAQAIDDNTVEVVYNGTTATVTIADNIANDITVSSGTSSHVVIKSARGNRKSVEFLVAAGIAGSVRTSFRRKECDHQR